MKKFLAITTVFILFLSLFGCNRTPISNNSTNNDNTSQFPSDNTISVCRHENVSDWIIDKIATISEAGLKHIECINCQEKINEEIIPTISENHTHSATEWTTTKYANCTTSGNQSKICSCGKTLETREIPIKGHTIVNDKAVVPSCTTDGLTEGKHCSVCNTVITKQKSISATGHSMSSKKVTATSSKEEHTLHFCTKCSYSYEEFPSQTSQLKFKSNNDGTCSVIGLNDTTITNLVIPQKSPSGNTVTSISDSAFKNNTTLKSVTLPSTVNQIGEFAFCGCTNLKAVNGSQYATTIKGSAFAESPLITSLDLSGATTLGDYICASMINLSSVKLSNKLKKLPQGMFASCTSLLEINLPSSITVIGNAAFQATNIESIILPDSVEEIEMYAFRYCRKLKNIKLPQNLKTINSLVFEQCKNLNNVVLPYGLQTLESSAFEGCKSLTSIILPDTLTTIGNTCFFNCTSLSSVTLPSNIKTIPYRLFLDCTSLTSITLPSSLNSIQLSAFQGTSLTTLNIPDSCTSIGESAFSHCAKLTSVSFGKNLKKIGRSAFSGCTLLSEISLPNTFEDLGDSAFYNCTGLKKVYLGTSITNIGSTAFANCTGLTSMFLPKSLSVTKTESSISPFYKCSGTLLLYTDATQFSGYWESYFGRISWGVSYDEYLKITQ